MIISQKASTNVGSYNVKIKEQDIWVHITVRYFITAFSSEILAFIDK